MATDAAKQGKFMEGLNDEMSMQLMVATFANYQELVDRALMIEGKQQQIESRKRKYGQGKYNSGAQQKPRFTPNSGGYTHNHGGHTHNGGSSHNHSGPKNGNGNGNGGSSSQNRSNHYKKYTSVMIRVCHSRSRFLSCMYIHDNFMTESR